jgi:O-antigen ligase
MTTISSQEGTGQSRIQLWSDALIYFRESPLFGIGMDNFSQFSSHVAHNSFIHAYTELGILGGTLFLGAFYFAIRGLYERRSPSTEIDPELQRLHPFLMGMLIAYTIGICFLSRNYIVPTYMFLGLAIVYMRLHSAQTANPILTWNRFVWPRLAGISVCFFVGASVFVRLFVNWQ